MAGGASGLLGGIGGFAVAHAAYLAEIRRRQPASAESPGPAPTAPGRRGPAGSASAGAAGSAWPGGLGIEAAVAGAVWAAAGHVLWRRLDTDADRRLRVPVLGYAALVTAMGAAAVRVGRRTPGRPDGPSPPAAPCS